MISLLVLSKLSSFWLSKSCPEKRCLLVSDKQKQQKYERLHDVLFAFLVSAFKDNFHAEVWLRSANSRKSIDENTGAENFFDYSFLGKEVDNLHIDTWLQEFDDGQWLPRLDLGFNINLAGQSVRFLALIHGNKLTSLEMDEDEYEALSLEEIDAFRKAVITHYGLLRLLT